MNKYALISMTICFFILACGGAQNDFEQIEETQFAPESNNKTNEPSSNLQIELPKKEAKPGTIIRKDLQQILNLGPAAVLAMVETEPVRNKGKFAGFKLVKFENGNPSAIDLKAGDILVSVNSKKIVKPDDFFRVFQELMVASELRFNIIREGQEKQLSYPIVD